MDAPIVVSGTCVTVITAQILTVGSSRMLISPLRLILYMAPQISFKAHLPYPNGIQFLFALH